MSSQETRADYKHLRQIQTRWMDNDVYAHINNVVYYSFFDTIVNEYLVEEGALDIEEGGVIGLVIETQCNYFTPVAFPDKLDGGVRVAKIGNSSVRYELAIFRNGSEHPVASGHFVHVYVDRKTRRPTSLPGALKIALEKIAA